MLREKGSHEVPLGASFEVERIFGDLCFAMLRFRKETFQQKPCEELLSHKRTRFSSPYVFIWHFRLGGASWTHS